MEENEDMEIDPAVAAAMGFSGFGTQLGKKRKFSPNDGFVGTATSTDQTAKGTGANETLLGDRSVRSAAGPTLTSEKLGSTTNDQYGAAQGEQPADHEEVKGSITTANDVARTTGNEGPTLEALRNGVRNERGDMVYFLPSFLEDPWQGLKPR